VNDVLLAAFSLSLERYLASRKELLDQNFWFMIPTSMRKSSDWSVSNQTSGYFLEVPISGCDPIKALKSVSKGMKIAKISTTPVWGLLVFALSFVFPNLVPRYF
jgi:hypothetical protein